MARLTDPLTIGGLTLRNRLYRAPLLECAGNGPEAVDRLIDHLEPAAASGAGLICQGATIVREEGGCAAPGMTRIHDPAFVERLGRLTDRIHDHGGAIAIQLEHGGLRSIETWHAERRAAASDRRQLAVSEPPWQLRTLDRLGFLSYDPAVMSTAEVRELAAEFGRAAARAVEAGYDAVHLSGANMGIVQQFCSPLYNRRDDAFGIERLDRRESAAEASRTSTRAASGSGDGGDPPRAGVAFLELVAEEIRDRAGEVPLLTKVPAETAAPPFVRRRLDRDDAVALARRLAAGEYDAVVPVEASTFWDMSVVRGEYPGRAFDDDRFTDDYRAAFGGRLRAAAVKAATRVESLVYGSEPAWNAPLCRRIREVVDVPVLLEGGVRSRATIDAVLGPGGDPAAIPSAAAVDGSGPPAADAVGLGRPFYAEPRLPARLLADADAAAVCDSCNNCAVPQATGAEGVCRTPSVLEQAGQLRAAGAYERPDDERDSPASGGGSAATDDGSAAMDDGSAATDDGRSNR